MRVLDSDTAKRMVGSDRPTGWFTGQYKLNMTMLDIVLLLGRPTTQISHIRDYKTYYWMLHDDESGTFTCLGICDIVSFSAEKILQKIRLRRGKLFSRLHLELEVYFLDEKASCEKTNMVRLHQLFESQLNWIKSGMMEQELSLLGDVQPLIEPINKKRWLKSNLLLIDSLRNAYLRSSKFAELISTGIELTC